MGFAMKWNGRNNGEHRAPRGGRTRRTGQALVEMALVAPVLILITMGLMQYGLIYNAGVTLENITRDTARFGAVHGADTSFTVNGTTYSGTSSTSGLDAGITAYAKLVAAGTSIKPTDLSVAVSPINGNSGRTGGQTLTVTINYDMHKKFFLPTSFPGLGSFDTTYTTVVRMIIEGQ